MGEESKNTISRREFLERGARGALVATTAGWLVSHGSLGTVLSPLETVPTVKRGGTLTVGMITGGSSETLDPAFASAYVDFGRSFNLFDRLFELGVVPTLGAVPGLATAAEPNKDATVWTIHLRDDVTWHDGKPFTADDVLWSMHTFGEPTNAASGYFRGVVDFGGVRKRGPLTVEVPLVTPVGQFPTIFTFVNCGVIQNGATHQSLDTHPIGTGPFKFVSWTPGAQSEFAANQDYWRGSPYLSKLIFDSSFTDESARLDALLSGQQQVNPACPFVIAKQQQSSSRVKLLNVAAPYGYVFECRVDNGPFADPQVMEAFKLAVDRPAMVEEVLFGYGTPGNDLQGGTIKGGDVEYFASSLHRERDVEKAKYLMKKAGKEGLIVTVPTANPVPGLVEATTLAAAQVSEIGLILKPLEVEAGTYWATGGTSQTAWGVRSIGLNTYPTEASMTVINQTWFTQPSEYNATHWGLQPGGAVDERLIRSAMAALEPKKATDLWYECQLEQFNSGGTLLFANANYTDLIANNVHGVTTTAAFYCNNFNFREAWLS
jgi:peptide/nickel transport system substrate-binding protein